MRVIHKSLAVRLKSSISTSLGNHPKLIVGVVAFLAGIFVSEPAKLYLTEYLSSKQLSYEIVSVSRFNRHEVQRFADSEGLGAFNLKLDDPIVGDYMVVKARLQNGRNVINSPLRFSVSLGNRYAKVLDIVQKVIYPVNKSVPIRHSIPDLTWDLEKAKLSTRQFTLAWDDPGNPASYAIYRSLAKTAGYGRINDRLITGLHRFKSNASSDFLSSFYAISEVHCSGESTFSEPLAFPATLAFGPHFKDVVWIDPKSSAAQMGNGSERFPYTSLSEATNAVKKATTFIIRQKRPDVTSFENLSHRVVVLYEDDLSFLEGKAELTFLSGIDKNAEILVYFLCKSMDDIQYEFSLRLEGTPEVAIVKRSGRMNERMKVPATTNAVTDPKLALTPFKVSTYISDGTVFLIWEKPHDPSYKGVRIFRSLKRQFKDHLNLGEEIYDGPGLTNNVTCTCENTWHEDRGKNSDKSDVKNLRDIEPPRRRGMQPKRPLSPPSHLRLISKVNVRTKETMPFFADNGISSGRTYTYFLLAYSDDDRYSYPIMTTVSLGDDSLKYRCSVEDK